MSMKQKISLCLRTIPPTVISFPPKNSVGMALPLHMQVSMIELPTEREAKGKKQEWATQLM